jgi:hypothetical protein
MKKTIISFSALFFALLLLSGWGGKGHYIISTNSAFSYNTHMAQFQNWVSYLADHASDADYRKSQDPSEGPKHYIDIDNYPEFLSNGYISQDYDSLIQLHGSDFVSDQGSLPWATLQTYDSLIACFKRRDWSRAQFFAADLGHYVADGHMPLHLTRNYNGQFSGNYGIHGRYESDMIARYENEIHYSGKSINPISNISDYIFHYIYENYLYVDSILLADDTASLFAGNHSSDAYYSHLWNRTKSTTLKMFADASHAFAEILYSAWYEAGTPGFSASILTRPVNSFELYPVPATKIVHLKCQNYSAYQKTIHVYDLLGNVVLRADCNQSGKCKLDVSELKRGVYFVVLDQQIKKLVLAD